jgi:SAM-dependent methyltransferase
MGPGARGFDLGCGSGRSAKLFAPRVGGLACVDASDTALAGGTALPRLEPEVQFSSPAWGAISLADRSKDFGYSLGVLHHVPGTAADIRSSVHKLKPGAPFLVSVYDALDNRPCT